MSSETPKDYGPTIQPAMDRLEAETGLKPVLMPSLEGYALTRMNDIGDEHEALLLPVANVLFIFQTPESVDSWVRMLAAGGAWLRGKREAHLIDGEPDSDAEGPA